MKTGLGSYLRRCRQNALIRVRFISAPATRITEEVTAKLAGAVRIPPAFYPKQPENELRHQVDLLLSYSF